MAFQKYCVVFHCYDNDGSYDYHWGAFSDFESAQNYIDSEMVFFNNGAFKRVLLDNNVVLDKVEKAKPIKKRFSARTSCVCNKE